MVDNQNVEGNDAQIPMEWEEADAELEQAVADAEAEMAEAEAENASEEQDDEKETEEFALSPAQAVRGIIKLNTNYCLKLFNHGISNFMGDQKYDREPSGHYHFINMYSARADEMGWTEVIDQIPEGGDEMTAVDNKTIHLTTRHG